VVTSATIRRSEPHPDAPAIIWPRTAAILDADGRLLTEVDAAGPPRGGRVFLNNVDKPAALLDYCFGHGCRRVMLSLGDAALDGWLGTRWEGSFRSWWLEVDE
jgi:hypothetical protein